VQQYCGRTPIKYILSNHHRNEALIYHRLTLALQLLQQQTQLFRIDASDMPLLLATYPPKTFLRRAPLSHKTWKRVYKLRYENRHNFWSSRPIHFFLVAHLLGALVLSSFTPTVL
jgi:hypothetical protein